MRNIRALSGLIAWLIFTATTPSPSHAEILQSGNNPIFGLQESDDFYAIFLLPQDLPWSGPYQRGVTSTSVFTPKGQGVNARESVNFDHYPTRGKISAEEYLKTSREAFSETCPNHTFKHLYTKSFHDADVIEYIFTCPHSSHTEIARNKIFLTKGMLFALNRLSANEKSAPASWQSYMDQFSICTKANPDDCETAFYKGKAKGIIEQTLKERDSQPVTLLIPCRLFCRKMGNPISSYKK